MDPSLVWLSVSLFIWGIGEGMFLIFQPIYLSQLGANPLQIGAILSAAGVAMVISHIPAGYLSDRFGRRPLLFASWILGLISTWVMALAQNLPPFTAGLVLYSFTAFVTAPLNSYVTTARGKWSVARAITLISVAFNLGAVVGPFAGGWVGDHFGLRTVFFVSGSIFVLSNVLIYFIRPQPRDQHDPAAPPSRLLANRPYLNFLALGFLICLATYLPQPFTAKFLQDVRHLSLGSIGLLGTFGGVGNTLLTFFLGQLEARVGFVLGQIAVGLFTLLLWRETGFEWLAVGYVLLGGYRATRALFSAQIRPLIHISQMGLAYGIAEAVSALTLVIAPVLAGLLYEKDPASIFPIALAAILFGAALSVALLPHQPQATSAEPMLEIRE
jgi:predicted MFS family arabinose efflux permease